LAPLPMAGATTDIGAAANPGTFGAVRLKFFSIIGILRIPGCVVPGGTTHPFGVVGG